jgi:UDP-N-acetylmuramate--alanine ligase
MTETSYKKIHCIGIGGIGLSALARYYNHAGVSVSGSDSHESALTKTLSSENIKVFADGHREENLPDDADLVIYTIAISSDNEELIKAHRLGCKLMTYPEALGELTRTKKTICISGTHGKTTTTAMFYKVFVACGISPTVIVGSLVKDNKENFTNFIAGDSEYLIIESCEYRRSFLNYTPAHMIVTNIEADHLDYYKDLDDIKLAFQEFVNKLDNKEKTAYLAIHDEERYLNAKDNVKKVLVDQIEMATIDLSVPGIHNRKNAQLVIGLANALGLDSADIRRGLKSFTGTWRRQEYKGEFYGATFYDDYAHHPSEIKATLQAFREKFPDKKIIVCFQPHLYSRTKLLFQDFVTAFTDADQVVLLPIYAARENYDPSINSEILSREIENINKKSIVLQNVGDLYSYMQIHANKNTVFITLGAGDIYKVYGYLI